MSHLKENAADSGGEGPREQATGILDERLLVSGSIVDAVSTLSALTLDLVVGTGTAGKQRFLVPYVDIEMDGEFFATLRSRPDDVPSADRETIAAEPDKEDEKPEEIADAENASAPHKSSVILSFDNVAFAFERSANRYRKLVKILSHMASDEIGPMPGRVEYAADALSAASLELSKAAATLRTMLPDDGQRHGGVAGTNGRQHTSES